MKYESTILKRLIDTYGVVGNPRYISEIIKEFIVRGKECFPNLFTYQSDWLVHIDEFGLNPSYTVSYTGQSFYAPNTLERPVKSAILKGSTKYCDIDTGELLETFEEGRNLELVSVKIPVLTTSNEDGTKTNILTVNEEVELRGIGDVKDTLDCLTGEVVQNIGEIVLDGNDNWYGNASFPETNDYKLMQIDLSFPIINATNTNILCDKIRATDYSAYNAKEFDFVSAGKTGATYVLFVKLNKSKLISADKNGFNDYFSKNPTTVYFTLLQNSVKTVDLTILDQNGQNVKQLMSFNGGTHFNTGSLEGSLPPSVSVCVETDLEETLKVCSLEGNTM